MAHTIESLRERIEIIERRLEEYNTSPSTNVKRTSGYLEFINFTRPSVSKRLHDEANGEKVKITLITKELARMWKELDESVKMEWKNKASAIKDIPVWLKVAETSTEKLKHISSNVTNELTCELASEPIDETEELDIEVEIERPTETIEHNIPEKKEEKKEEISNGNEKKKRISGYIIFQKELRPSVLQELIDNSDGAKIKQSAVLSELGKMWKALDDDDKEAWNNKALKLKQQC